MGYNIHVLSNPTNPQFAYVMIHTGEEEDYKKFLDKELISAT